VSIALNARIKELERRIGDLVVERAVLQQELEKMTARLTALENRPRPGRPPKEQP
jgi:regulator of replication initiation timing